MSEGARLRPEPLEGSSAERRSAGVDGVGPESLLAKLTLEQKVRLLTGADWWALHPEPAIGLRAMVLSDGPVGVRGTRNDERDTSLSLPAATALAASWDPELLRRMARLLAAEARRKGVDVVLGPTVNLHRSPRGGRHFECYSEDPVLTAVLGTAYVAALQECGVGATPKHYVANDSETDRFTVDVRVSERALREVYLRPFEETVRAGGAWLVMAAYNSVHGTTMTEHPLLAEPLKGEWGFDGVVVSDWFAARTVEAAGTGGLDLVMPADNSPWGDALVAAVRNGSVPEAAVDDKVRRLLRLAGRVGALAGGPPAAPVPPVPDPAAELRAAAAAGMVLLANPAGVLPIDPGAVRRVALLGPHAATARTQGGGSAHVNAAYTVSPLAGLRTALAGTAEVSFVAGARLDEGLVPLAAPVLAGPDGGEPGVLVEWLAADGSVLGSELRLTGALRYTSGDLPPGAARLRASARLCPDEAGDWRVGFTGIGDFTLTVSGEVVCDEAVYPDGGDMVSVFASPPTRTVARTLAAGQELPVAMTYDLPEGIPATLCVLGYERPERDAAAELERAAAAARDADVAVVVVGTTERVESEGLDRASLALPGNQDELVRAVAAANPRTVVVVNAGAPVLMPWRDEVAAVLLAWFGGQEMGAAVADVLLGAAEPGGRLPTTWPAEEADVPVLDTTPRDGRLEYAEGVHIGYRAWLRAGRAPAYPFGHGLGYTTWEYEGLSVLRDGDGFGARVTVRNAGARAGKEVVQVYLSRDGSTVERPAAWLAGSAVIRAESGETVTSTVPLDRRAVAHWSQADGAWRVEPGTFRVAAGRSVADLRLTADLLVD